MEKIQGKKDLTSIVLAVLLIAALLYSGFLVFRPFLPATIWASMIVISSWPIMLSVQRRLRGSRTLAVMAMTGVLVLLLILPLTIAVVAIVDNINLAGEKIAQLTSSGIPELPQTVKELPFVGASFAKTWEGLTAASKEELFSKIKPFIGTAVTWIMQQIGGLGMVLVHFLLTILIAIILYFKGEVAARGLLSFARRLANERGESAVILASQAIRAVANGVVVTALIQSALAGVGLLIAGVPYAFILASIAFLLSVIQIGVGPVLIGAIIWLAYNAGSFTLWAFVIWAVIVMSVDNFIRPFLIRRGADLPLLLIFSGVIGGIISFGIIGIFVGPVVLAVGYTLLRSWVDEKEG
jgi:predicted PurR-regulated permease PerM